MFPVHVCQLHVFPPQIATAPEEFKVPMMLETETVLDRRRLRRHVSFWRMAAVTAAVVAVGALAFTDERVAGLIDAKHIARVSFTGTITEDRDQLKLLKKLAEDDQAAAVLVFVNSPGGTSTGGEAIYEELRGVARKKPVVVQFGTIAASAGYIIGLAGDHIVSRGNTITGSVGVLVQWPEVTDLMDRFGIKVHEVKSGELKATPSPFQKLDEKSRQVTKEMVDDSFKWFLDLVKERRGIDPATVAGLDKGRIFTGRQALEAKLIDELGGEAEAVKWLEEKRSIDKDLKVVERKPEKASGWFGQKLFRSLARDVAADMVDGASEALARNAGVAPMRLDGLLSVWHPGEN